MPFTGIVDPGQLTILTAAVDEYCREAGVDPASAERDEIACFVMTLFTNGATTAGELRALLQARSGREVKRYG